jgi:hypothetical protein
MNKKMVAKLLAQPHRANAANPATAHCAMWLSPEQLAERKIVNEAKGQHITGTVPCACGNHDRVMWG